MDFAISNAERPTSHASYPSGPADEDDSMQLTYPDGSVHEFAPGTTGSEVAASIGARLAKAAVAVSVDGTPWDLERPLPADGGAFAVITDASEDGRHIMRHSAAHVLAQAVLDLFPEAETDDSPLRLDIRRNEFQQR